MLLPAPPKFPRKRNRPSTRPSARKPAAALTLVSATYDELAPSVTLTFDRAIDIGAMQADQVTVNDEQATGLAYAGDGAAMSGATAVVVSLTVVGAGEGPTMLNASAANGIVAVDDGGAWEGATNLALPFP